MTALPFNDLYKEFRNRTRPYQPASILQTALSTLRQKSEDKVQDLRMAPWLTLLIVKWVLQDSMARDAGSRTISQREFDALRQHLYEFPERMTTPTGISLPLFVRRIQHQQVAFQREIYKGFLREAALLGTLQPAHPLRSQFEARAAMTPESFIDLSLAAFTAVIVDGKVSLPFGWFDPLQKAYGSKSLQAFYSLVSRDYGELRDFCRNLPERVPKVASEYYESTPLRRYPFLRSDKGLECWHPMVFFRGMEAMVHSLLSEAGEEYIQPFSQLFEEHIVREAVSTGFAALNETELRKLLGQSSRVPDILLSFPEANVFIEAKAGLFDESVMTTADRVILSHKTKALRTAIQQGWTASMGLRRSQQAPPQVRTAPIDYLLVVTNRDLETSRASLLKQMYPEGKLEYPDETVKQLLPLERIYLLNVEEFERLVAAVRGGVHLPTMLSECVLADSRPDTSKFFFEQHLTSQKIALGTSAVVTDALDRATARLEAALNA